MYPKFKTNLIGVAVAMGFVLIGFGLGEPPRLAYGPAVAPSAPIGLQADAEPVSRTIRHGAFVRHLAMPYISFGALTPRQES